MKIKIMTVVVVVAAAAVNFTISIF